MKIRNSVIDSIMLNEACSSGCGSLHSDICGKFGTDTISFSQRGAGGRQSVDLGYALYGVYEFAC